MVDSELRKGFWYGFAAYVSWGLFPLYWTVLQPAGATEILAMRVVCSLLFIAVLLSAVHRWSQLRDLVADRRRLLIVSVGAVMIAINWGTFIYAVTSGHVIETALGYFINPLVLVAMGVLLLGERLRPAQWVALTLAAVAVVGLTIDYGRPPYIALTLAFSFGTYGLMKKRAGVGASEGLALETAILAPLALAWLVWLQVDGQAAFGHEGWVNTALLLGTGVVTTIPLLLFGGAATRIPMTTLGLLQYIAPVMQFMFGLWLFDEDMSTARWVGFSLVWVSLLLLTADSVRRRHVDAVDVAEPSRV
ncbi:MAG TPA: EamA family transporter RarD [Nocardioidaceae bacterium]|nr:EamA family transporter RarD [Nocardioidaceae bacterium]